MGTSQDLVPTDQPYGSRQQTVSAMQAADVPLSSEGGGGGPVPPGPELRRAIPPSAPPATSDLQQFDVLAGREPTPDFQATSPRQVAFEQVRQSPNRVMQAIAERMQGYKEG